MSVADVIIYHDFRQEMATRERALEEAKGRILVLEDSVLNDGNVREEMQRDCDAKIQEVKAETHSLHRQIEQASKVIEQLQVFKKAYTDLENSRHQLCRIICVFLPIFR
jgi:phosphoribosyl 1,2-cyclic phosphodiesterase